MKERDTRELETGDKWEVQLRKGCLELAILAALWDGKRYGLEILRRLERFGFDRFGRNRVSAAQPVEGAWAFAQRVGRVRGGTSTEILRPHSGRETAGG